jgi:TolB-like protein
MLRYRLTAQLIGAHETLFVWSKATMQRQLLSLVRLEGFDSRQYQIGCRP